MLAAELPRFLFEAYRPRTTFWACISTKLVATNRDGFRGYLRSAAILQMSSYLALIGRFIPAELNVKTDTKVTVKYGTMEERRQALIERGIDPDALERAMQPKFLLEYNSSKDPV